jgi:SPX domain protein involved in polyphosphate accumulation
MPAHLLVGQEAQRIGDDFLALEKYVNLNYMVGSENDNDYDFDCNNAAQFVSCMVRSPHVPAVLHDRVKPALTQLAMSSSQGFHKILKKHDKCLPQAPCRQFYIAHLHQQPWVQVRGVKG